MWDIPELPNLNVSTLFETFQIFKAAILSVTVKNSPGDDLFHDILLSPVLIRSKVIMI